MIFLSEKTSISRKRVKGHDSVIPAMFGEEAVNDRGFRHLKHVIC